MTSLLVHRLSFAATANAPGCARRFVERSLSRWLMVNVIESALLVASELVTNAVRATIPGPLPTGIDVKDSSIVAVQVRAEGDILYIEVWDADSKKPVKPDQIPHVDADELAEHGRGLSIVSALSRRFGTHTIPDGGKVVWSEMDAGGRVPQGLPGRPVLPMRRKRPYVSGEKCNDPHVLAERAFDQRMLCTN